mgnify:CR=1 FL=1
MPDRIVASVMLCLLITLQSSCRSKYASLEGVVSNDRVVNATTVRHGVDTMYLYEIIGGRETVNQFINAWQLAKVENSSKISFLNDDTPQWWLQCDCLPLEKYYWSDEPTERYRSLWFCEDGNKLFVECGQW